MNFIVFFLVCLIALISAEDAFSAEFKEKLINKMQEVGAKCAAQEKASDEDIGELMNKKPPSRKEGKCLIACVNQELGYQDAAGKFSKEGLIKALEPFKKENEGIYNKLMEVMDKCMKEVKSSDRCDAAAEISHCFMVDSESAGLTPGLVM